MGEPGTMVSRVLAVVGATRGIGRSSVALNLAVAVAQRGRRVCLLDADGGTSGAGATPAATLLDVAAGRARLSDALAPAPNGLTRLVLTTPERRPPAVVSDAVLLAHVDALESRFDLVVVDAPPGTQARGLFFAAAATDVLLVVTPQEVALRQAGTLMRLLATRCGRRELLVLPNACQGPDDATAIGRTLATLAGRSPHVRVLSLGWIPFDDAVSQARRARRALVTVAPEAPAARALVGVAARLETLAPSRPTGGAQFFFQSLIAQGRAA